MLTLTGKRELESVSTVLSSVYYLKTVCGSGSLTPKTLVKVASA